MFISEHASCLNMYCWRNILTRTCNRWKVYLHVSVPRYSVKIAYIGLVKQPEGCSSLPLSLDLQKRCICNYFPLFLPHHYCTDLPLSLIFILVVHQELCFDIHATPWLRCKRDSCEVLGHLLLLMCLFHLMHCFHPFLSLSPPILGCCIWHFFSLCSWVCTSITIWLLYIMWFT